MHVAALVPVLYVAVVTPVLVRVDLREHRLPNLYVVPGIGVGIVAAAAQWSLLPVTAGACYAGLLLLLAVGGGVGMGDVKLALLLGLACPAAGPAFAAPVLAFLLGGAAACLVLIRRGRGARIAFGPWMLAGYWIAVVGDALGSSIAAGAP